MVALRRRHFSRSREGPRMTPSTTAPRREQSRRVSHSRPRSRASVGSQATRRPFARQSARVTPTCPTTRRWSLRTFPRRKYPSRPSKPMFGPGDLQRDWIMLASYTPAALDRPMMENAHSGLCKLVRDSWTWLPLDRQWPYVLIAYWHSLRYLIFWMDGVRLFATWAVHILTAYIQTDGLAKTWDDWMIPAARAVRVTQLFPTRFDSLLSTSA